MSIKLSHEKLHILAMLFMLVDHLGMLIFPQLTWMRSVGRLAFPIFCFMIVEGYYHTSNNKKYAIRLLISAIISEIPFDYMVWGTWLSPYQNVMWTLLIGLLSINIIDRANKLKNIAIKIILNIIIVTVSYLLGQVLIVDYYGAGVLQVLVFYYGHGKELHKKLLQVIGLYYINYVMLGGYEIELGGFDIPQQAIGILSLAFIWLYNEKKELKGTSNKVFKYICYGFYPVHMIVLYFVYKMILR